MQTFDPDISNTPGSADKSAEKLPVSALDRELFNDGDRRSIWITVAAESYPFGDEPRREIGSVKRLDFDRGGELFLQPPDDGIARERPAADHKHSRAAD